MTASTAGPPRLGSARRAALLAALAFLVAINLRPALTAVGPLLPQIGADKGLDEAAQGLLGALPLLGFAVVSPLVHRASRRVGAERLVLLSLLVLAAGTLIRSYTGIGGLWLGTALLGGAIAVGNVLVPALIKRDYAGGVSAAMGVYAAFMALPAALASAVAVPIANATDWRAALAFWSVPALLVAAIWTARVRAAANGEIVVTAPEHDAGDVPVSVWRQPTAWLVTGFMALQSTMFFVMVTWLPTISSDAGASAGQAGVHLFVFVLVGVPAGLAIPLLMRGPGDQVRATVTASVPVVLGTVGLWLAPELAIVWAALAGAGIGASLAASLALIGLRGRTHDETTQLSGMAQSVGYLLAACGPLLIGALAERTGSWDVPLGVMAGIALLQLTIAVGAGRDRRA